MYILRQNVILIAICLAITTALPQQNIKYSKNLQLNGKDEFNIDKHLNEYDKEKLMFSHISDIYKGRETDLSALNIPLYNKQNNLNILNDATKSKVDDNKTVNTNNNVNIPKTTEFNLKPNEPNSSKLNFLFSSKNNDLDIINTAIESINKNSNNSHNKTHINMDSHKPKQSKEESLNTKLHTSTIESGTKSPKTSIKDYTTSNEKTDISPTTTVITSVNSDTIISDNATKTIELTTINPSIETSTISPGEKSSDNNTSNDDILLSEITQLSSTDGEALKVGQKITVLRSDINSDIDEKPDSAGIEILKNVSSFCGSALGKRISFANETTLMEFPWTALLLYNTNLRYHCGGSLITKKYVLTAAHCVAQEFYELTGVRLGEHDITENPDCALDLVGANICATTVDADVVKIIIHHGFSHVSFKNDIALLQLDKEYVGRSFYPICLPKPNDKNMETQAIVAGWGATQNAIRSTVLLKADVPILDMSRCREIYRYSVFNDSTEICGSGVNEVDVCKGDSGGAIFLRRSMPGGREKYFQLGIISLGVRQCGDARFLPAVFTKIKGFYKWIENNIES